MSLPGFILIGGSAGSLQALFTILAELKSDFNLPVLLALHRLSTTDSNLEDALAVKTHLQVEEVEEKEPIQKGHLYICPPDYHVLIEPDETFSLDASERINFSRPSLDVIFKSAAEVFEKRLTAILLSGANTDGAEGLSFVKEKGGTTVVQDPSEAVVSYMPLQALKQMSPDHVLTSQRIGQFLNSVKFGSSQ